MKQTKLWLTTIAVLLCSLTANAYDFEVEGLYYNLLSASEKTCELVGSKPGITNVNIPASVTTRGMTLTVSSIKESAFEGETDILSVSFVNSPMTIVPKDAFKDCTNLNQVELSNTLETIEAGAFDGCPIDSLIIPASIKTVGEKSLSNVRKIEIVNSNEPISFSDAIPTITSAFIGRNITQSFLSKSSVSTVSFGIGITEIIPSMFEGCKQIQEISIPANIIKIGDNAFNGCEQLTRFRIEDSDSVLALGKTSIWTDREIRNTYGYALHVSYQCTHRGLLFSIPIKELYIGRNLTYPSTSSRGEFIGETIAGTELISVSGREYNVEIVLSNYDYSGSPFNEDVESIQFGDKVTQIGNFFFENQRISSFKVPNNCKVLGDYCFYNCQNLESIDLNNCDKLGNRTFNGCSKLQNINWGKTRIIGEATFSNCSNISSIDLIEVDSICANAFKGCAGLKKVTISDNVKDIQQAAFSGCSNLRMVSIGEGISSLPKDCFSECKSLEWVSLGANILQVNSGVFTGCSQIAYIEVKNVNPPIFESENELSSVNKFDATLYIPQGSTSAYEQAEVWKEFLFKQESDIPEYVYTQSKPDDSEDNSKTFVVKGDLTGAIINQINANSVIENLDLQAASIALDNQNIYYESGKRVDSHWDDVDVVRGAPYYSYKYYTAPETTSGQKKEYNSSGYLINVITTCFSSDLTNANLNGNLKSIKLPSSLTKLGENAIKGTKLTDLYVYSTTPPTATAASFGNIDKATCILHVPEGCKAAYENAAGWKGFTNIIEPLSGTGNYIMVHPTNENCQVELAQNDTNAIYQWYKYVEKTDRVIDITNLLTTTAGWGSTDNKWISNMHDAASSATLSYEHTFNAGDELSFDWVVSCEGTFDQLQFYFNEELLFVKSGEDSGSFSKVFDTSMTGEISFVYIKDNIIDSANDNVQISNVKISSLQEQSLEIPETIDGEIGSKLAIKSIEYNGNRIFCIVTLGDGKQLKSSEFIWVYKNFIKTQPTAENLQVKLDTPDDNAKYQWRQQIEKTIYCKEIIPTSTGDFAWTESNGIWTSGNKEGYFQHKSIMTATIDVQIGDTISFDYTAPAGGGSQWFAFYVNGHTEMMTFGGNNGSSGSCKLPIDEYVFDDWLNGNSQATIEFECVRNRDAGCATVSNLKHIRPVGFSTIIEDEEIVGATTGRLDDSLSVEGTMVYCIITLPDGNVLTSDKVDLPVYVLTYVIDNEVYHTDTVRQKSRIVLPKTPDKEGYTFNGWDDMPEIMPANDVTISGTFTVNKYLVTFKINDEVIVSDSLEYGAAIVAPEAPEREGHTFNGWGDVVETVPANDVTIEGSYTANIYKVYYYVGEELVHTAEVTYGEAIPEYIYEPTEEGYTFLGWLGEVYETMPAHDVTYTANIESGINQLLLDNGQLIIYDLMGRKVLNMEDLKGGIYIVNGKKVVVK